MYEIQWLQRAHGWRMIYQSTDKLDVQFQLVLMRQAHPKMELQFVSLYGD